MRALKGVEYIVGDQCVHGQQVQGRGWAGIWGKGLARKPTGWLTNLSELRDVLGQRCPGGHEHVWLLGGRAKGAERYPPSLITAILRTLRKRLRQDRGVSLHAVEIGVGQHMDELDATPELPDPEPDGSVNTEELLERPVAWDEYTGLRLDPDLV